MSSPFNILAELLRNRTGIAPSMPGATPPFVPNADASNPFTALLRGGPDSPLPASVMNLPQRPLDLSGLSGISDAAPSFAAPSPPPNVMSNARSVLQDALAQQQNPAFDPKRLATGDVNDRPGGFWHTLGRNLSYILKNTAAGHGLIPSAISAAAGGEKETAVSNKQRQYEQQQLKGLQAAQGQYGLAAQEQAQLDEEQKRAYEQAVGAKKLDIGESAQETRERAVAQAAQRERDINENKKNAEIRRSRGVVKEWGTDRAGKMVKLWTNGDVTDANDDDYVPVGTVVRLGTQGVKERMNRSATTPTTFPTSLR